MRFSSDFIERVREATDIVDIVRPHVHLKQIGNRWVGLCPFHHEKTPSFSVSQEKQLFYCFGCKKSGNVFHFIQEQEGTSFPDTLKMLAQRQGIPLPVVEGLDHFVEQKAQEWRQKLLKINRYAAVFYWNQRQDLSEQHIASKYILERGISKETIETFRLGVALESWTGLVDRFKEKRVPFNDAEKLGLIRKRTSTGYYDLFRQRVLFPIFSPTGDVLGFGGRTFANENPKYLNSSESPIFNKRQVLYGLFQTGKSIRENDEVIVVEGYMDLIKLYQAGIKNVVATLGTALTEDHARLLGRYTQRVTILFDGDEPGQMAADRCLPILLQAGLRPRGLSLPQSLDPDEFLSQFGVDELKQRLERAPELFIGFLDRLLVGFRPQPSEQIRIIEVVAPILETMVDGNLKELYLQEVAVQIGVDLPWLVKAIRASAKKKSAGENLDKNMGKTSMNDQHNDKKTSNYNKIQNTALRNEELLLLNLILADEIYMKRFLEMDLMAFLSPQQAGPIFQEILTAYRQNPGRFDTLCATFVSRMEDPTLVAQYLLNERLFDIEGGRDQLFTDCLKRVKERHLRGEAKTLAHQLREQEDVSQLERFMNVVKDRHSLKTN